MSRVSRVFCIMSNKGDMAAAARYAVHIPLYRRMVALEACSSFGFQGARCLADVTHRPRPGAMTGQGGPPRPLTGRRRPRSPRCARRFWRGLDGNPLM